MKKFKTVFSSILLASVAISLNAQQGMYSGYQADNICKGSTSVYYGEVSKVPSMITFGEHSKVKSENVMTILSSALNMRGEDQLIQYKEEADEIGFTHYRFQQYYNTIKVENGQYLVHSKNGSVQSVNGFWVDGINISVTPSISEQTAIQIAMKSTNASRFKWQMPEEEAQLKKMMSNSQATYYPKPELVIVARDFDYKKHEFHLCYKFDIYADTPMSRNWFYVDATSGEIIAKENSICNINVNATGNTMYSGVKPMITDSFAANTYRLRETARGLGVETYDMNTGTNYGLAVDFTNNSTFWNVATNYDRAAYDAHWGAESTYDYYLQVHSRNSIDNAGQKLYSYVHYDLNQNTGFWNGIAMSYGDGNHLPGGWNPATSLDVCGHEFTHGVTRNTAALLYVNESGALNESFSDIFGCSIEFFANPSQADWLMCEDIMVNVGTALRNLSNPNQYNQPDTYLGTNWATGFADFGGVHTNSGVQNFWYYLLCQGGVGVNDIASNYTVTGIGISDAERIAYRNLVFYIPSFATFMDARMYSIQAAQDIFGACSQQVISTTNAWYAVGVGSPFSAVIDANFTANGTTSCSVPFTVNFSNTSVNATNATWYFGDNTSSNVYNPSHTYTLPGTYSVKLVCSSSCGASDSILQSSLITITTPPAPTTTGASSCTSAALNLSASGTGNLNWFANPSGGTSIHTGTNFTTPVLPATTTYYVDNQIAGTTGFCGPADNTFGSGGNYGNIYEANMIFNVMQACTLRTVKVFCYNAGTRNITLRDVAGNLLQDYSVTLPVGQSTVNLNFPIEPGTGYRLGGDTLSMSLNNSNISYPYILNGVASITGCSASSSTTQLYLFFYNWEFETAPCTSVRTPVVGTINTPPTVTYTAAIDSVCFPGNAIALIGGSPAGGTYSGTGVSAGMFDPAVSGIGDFVVTYSYTDGNGCNATAQQTIHVDGCMGVTSSVIQTGMSVSPNPSDGNVTVEIGLARNENAKLRIMNSLGQIVRVEEHHLLSGNNKLQLNLSNLAKGIYYIQIQTSTDLVTKRIDLN